MVQYEQTFRFRGNMKERTFHYYLFKRFIVSDWLTANCEKVSSWPNIEFLHNIQRSDVIALNMKKSYWTQICMVLTGCITCCRSTFWKTIRYHLLFFPVTCSKFCALYCITKVFHYTKNFKKSVMLKKFIDENRKTTFLRFKIIFSK